MSPVRRLVPYLQRHRSPLLWGMGCVLLTVALQALSPAVLGYAVDDLKAGVTQRKLLLYAAITVGIVVVEGFFRYHMRMILIGASREIEYEIRNDLYRHLTRLPLRFYQSHRIGDLMSRATNDLASVRMLVGPAIMYMTISVATVVVTIALMARISIPLMLIALTPLFFVSLLVRYFGKKIHTHSDSVQAQLSHLTALVQENLSGARVVRAYAQEPYEIERFEQSNREYIERNRRLIRASGLLYPGLQLLLGTSALLVLWLGGQIVIRQSITLGEFVAFGGYLAMLHWPMMALGWVVNLFERGTASFARILEILDAPPEIEDGPMAKEISIPIKGDIEFRDLTFSYDGDSVLQAITLRIPAGRSLAILGPTGSGKSTLLSLIPRLHDPPAGALFIDGHDVRDLSLAVLRGSIGYVPQETFLFSSTLRENVVFGAEATEAQIMKAVETAHLSQDVNDFPRGLNTLVGERGLTLSGGQKQRTALARALVLDPPILLLDDAFSAVDTLTEENILQSLRQVIARRTTILVSHRTSTARYADQIVVLREGRIVERGTHEELLKSAGLYANLHRRQLLEEEVAQA